MAIRSLFSQVGSPDRKEARERASKAHEPPGQRKKAPLYLVYPTDGGSASVDAGDMLLDFYDGTVRLPNGDEERLSDKLEGSGHSHVNVVVIDRPSQDVDISLDGGGFIRIESNSFRAILFPTRKLRIKLTATTNLKVYAATDNNLLYAEGPPADVPTSYYAGTEKVNFVGGFGLAGTITTAPTDINFIVNGNLDNPITANADILKVMLFCHWRFQNSFAGANGLNNLVADTDNMLKMNAGSGFQDVDELTDDFANCLAQNDMIEMVTVHDVTDILTDLSATISLRLGQSRSDQDSLYVFLTPWVEVLFKSS